MAHVFFKADSNVCHTAAILDAAHGNIQQPAHNLVAVQTCHSQSLFFCPTLHHQNTDATACNVTATCNHAHLGTQSIQMTYKTHLYRLPVVKVADCDVTTN